MRQRRERVLGVGFNFHVYYVNLEDHLMRTVMLLEREVRSEVVLHQRSRLNSLEDGSINLLLVGLALITYDSRLGSVVGEELLLTLSTVGLDTSEVSIINLGNISTAHIHLGRGGNNISLVDPTKRNSVDFVRSSNEQKSRFQSLQAHNALATETSTEENADGSGGEGGTHFGSVVLLRAAVLWAGNVVGGVVSGRLALGGGGLGGLLWSSSSEYAQSSHFDERFVKVDEVIDEVDE
jgi:hypothetical protein